MIKVFHRVLIEAKHGQQLFCTTFHLAKRWLISVCTLLIEAN